MTYQVPDEMKHDLAKMWPAWRDNVPMISNWFEQFGYEPNSETFVRFIGTSQVLGGIAILIPLGTLSLIANFGLIVVMIGAIWSHFQVGDPIDKTAFSALFLVLLIARFMYQPANFCLTSEPESEKHEKRH